MIVMEMVGAKPVNVNACLIMSMHKIAHIMDVSTFSKLPCFMLTSINHFMHDSVICKRIGILFLQPKISLSQNVIRLRYTISSYANSMFVH